MTWHYAATRKCWTCGRTVKNGPAGRVLPSWRHACALRWFSRAKWRAHQDGWHSGYRWAVENRDDPLCLADGEDYGTGWAGHMRVGHMTIVHTGEEADR